jgi:hypothetical protein
MYDLRDGTLRVAEPDRFANAGYSVDIGAWWPGTPASNDLYLHSLWPG